MPEFTIELKWHKADLLLLLLFVLLSATIFFRVNVEATGYLSPDSKAYLGLAQNLLDGHGFYMQQEKGEARYFSIWPVGYPVLIFLVAKFSGLSIFWASKVLNVLLMGGGFLVLRRLCRPYAFLLASLYGSYTLLEVYSFTWSEAPFLLALLFLCYVTNQIILLQGVSNKHLLLLFSACAFLFLMRYVGAFSIGVPALLGVYFFLQKKNMAGGRLLLVSVLLAAFSGIYLYLNYALSGFMTGFDRLEAETESAWSFMAMLAEGIGNELLLIRKYRAGNQPDFLLYVTILLQLVTVAYVVAATNKQALNIRLKRNAFAFVCWLVAGLYLAAMILLRSLSHFDDLDYRLLAPCAFLFWLGLLHTLATLPDSHRGNVQAKYIAFAFLLISLLLNLPKRYIIKQVLFFLS